MRFPGKGKFFAKQPAQLKPILAALRKLVDEAAPEASASLKWGMPFYTIGSNLFCALAGFKAHVNLILPGPPGTYADPEGLLEGGGIRPVVCRGRALRERRTDDARRGGRGSRRWPSLLAVARRPAAPPRLSAAAPRFGLCRVGAPQNVSGFTMRPASLTSQCVCGPVVTPVIPTSATG